MTNRGNDQIYNRRKERSRDSFARKSGILPDKELVLIVSEDEKGSVNYFKDLIKLLRLRTADIRIAGKECGSHPINVVDFAIQEFKASLKNTRNSDSSPFDRVFCVFDRDTHARYNEVINKARSFKYQKKTIIEIIPSTPCFEYWYLLHFKKTTKPYHAAGKKTSCAVLEKDLKSYIQGYKHGYEGFIQNYHKTNIKKALKNACEVQEYNQKSDSKNPSTMVHALVLYLIELSERNGYRTNR